MKIVSINVNDESSEVAQKIAVTDPIEFTTKGILGNEQTDYEKTGVYDQSVLVVPESHYELLKQPKPHGFFGEHITIAGCTEETISIGDLFKINGVLLEVTQPREALTKTQSQIGSKKFLRKLNETGQVGFYCRVLLVGSFKVGDSVQYIPTSEPKFEPLNIANLFLAQYHARVQADFDLMALAIQHGSLSTLWRERLTAMVEQGVKMTKAERTKNWVYPPKSMLKTVKKAIAQFKMLKDGDKVIVGVSGGENSLVLLTVLKHLQRHAPIQFELAACTIDPKLEGYDPSKVKAWISNLDIPFFYQQETLEAPQNNDRSLHNYRSNFIRGKLYGVCRNQGYNVLALAQSQDDFAESYFMSAINTGKQKTLLAKGLNDAGDVQIIRPLVNVRSADTTIFAEDKHLPIVIDDSSDIFAKPATRQNLQKWLQSEERNNPHLYGNLAKAMQPLVSSSEETITTGKNENGKAKIIYKEKVVESMPQDWAFGKRMKWALSGNEP